MELHDSRRLLEGFTTGSCAAAAAQASALRLTTGRCPAQVRIMTPAGKELALDIVECAFPACGVVKDAGDDPDVTDGMMVISSVELGVGDGIIAFRAGPGVGTVTLPGLKIPVGGAAINPVPRQMIEEALRAVIGPRSACVTVSIPGGEEKAARTFNPRLGIVGGLSVLGTTGIVKPYNVESVYASLTLELSTFASSGLKCLGLCFGSSSESAMRAIWNIGGRAIMRTGNYVGFVLDEALRFRFERVLLCGGPGKLLKVAAGTFDTYNRSGGGGREALCTQAALAGAGRGVVRRLYASTTAEAAVQLIREKKLDIIWRFLAEVAAKRCRSRMFGGLAVEAAFIDNQGCLLGASSGAAAFAEELAHAQ